MQELKPRPGSAGIVKTWSVLMLVMFPTVGIAQSEGGFDSGYWLSRCKDRADTLVCIESLLEQHPNSHELLATHAWVLSGQEEWRKSLDEIDKAIELKPDQPDYHQLRAALLAKLGHEEEAHQAKEETARLRLAREESRIDEHPDDAQLYLDRARRKRLTGDSLGSIRDYERFLDLETNPSPRILGEYAEARRSSGDFEGALHIIELAIHMVDGEDLDYYARLLKKRAAIKRALGDIVGAEEDELEYKATVEKISQGDYAERILYYSKKIEDHPRDVTNYFERGLARLESGDVYGALDDAEKIIQVEPETWHGYSLRSRVRKALGDTEGSRVDRGKAERIITGTRSNDSG